MKRIGICILSLILSFSFSELVVSDISYQESTDFFLNPEQGFYKAVYTECTLEGCEEDLEIPSQQSIVHLRISLADFTKANNKVKDYDLTKEMISSLGNILKNYRLHNKNVILRFAYDDFEGIGDLEPETIEQVLTHIIQLKPIFEEYEDVIMTIESSLIGMWGEQHGSKIVTFENIAKMIDTYLEVVPESRTILVRRPSYYAYWKNINYDELYLDTSIPQETSYRVGVFNDGYLGSESDTGTFLEHPTLGWRKNEVTWLSNQATHTFYGGEVVSDRSHTNIRYNTAEYMMEEMYDTHTTYLNIDWNDTVIDSWRKSAYTGEDEAYLGQSSFNYIANHLGYRFVLRNSEISSFVKPGKELKIKGKIENVGAGNVINEKKATLILKHEEEIYSFPVELDMRKLLSKQITEYTFTIPISETFLEGEYDIYLHLSTISKDELFSKQNAIRFANENTWDDNLHANYLGTVKIGNYLNITLPISILFFGVSSLLCIASIIFYQKNGKRKFKGE